MSSETSPRRTSPAVLTLLEVVDPPHTLAGERPATQAAEIRGSTNVDHLAVEPDSTPAPASSPQS